jgi:hypothetical protein
MRRRKWTSSREGVRDMALVANRSLEAIQEHDSTAVARIREDA